jgi:hypothetical protein
MVCKTEEDAEFVFNGGSGNSIQYILTCLLVSSCFHKIFLSAAYVFYYITLAFGFHLWGFILYNLG